MNFFLGTPLYLNHLKKLRGCYRSPHLDDSLKTTTVFKWFKKSRSTTTVNENLFCVIRYPVCHGQQC
uniref:Ovule protein n=1 Tax=Parascaris univalens TaxID=6257 RepID=A0A915AFL3_PARUN